jgi:hypothetical protein
VHRFTVAISIRTNHNALMLLVQVHSLLQWDNVKEGGTEHGSIPVVAVVVMKL